MLRKSNESWSWPQFIWAILLIVLPNAAMYIFANMYSLERPYINVDYALVMLIILANQRLAGAIALVFAFFFDVLALMGQIFPILRFSDMPYMAKFIGVAPSGYKVGAIFLCFILIVFVFLFLFRNSDRKRLEFLACANLFIFAYAVSAIFGSERASQVWHSKARSIVSSQVVFGFDSRRTGFVDSLYVEGDIFSGVTLPSATKPWFDDILNLEDKVLLIVNESWGVTSQRIQSAVLSPLLESTEEIFDWEQGELTFNGMTVKGEIRELCQKDLLHFSFKGHEEKLKDCMPNRLRELGYETHSFHGAAGLMYDRAKWYPDIGFENLTFLESYIWPNRCYSFPGACDVDLANYVTSTYASDNKIFGYWLTLNTHHSYDLRDLSVGVLHCEEIGVDSDTEVCRNLKLQNQFFKSVAKVVSSPNMSGTRVIIVSDHEPRISNQAEMEKYFEIGKIPWVSFQVR
ncbi:sulfatase-like hydrolase/transferase [Marinobacter sp. DY40_1A1]|uniref:sulfatase-like hydrolase/transferase n=1 Tax=Marinobacter sp. DY40_1A1 TaxID=2583229 RepID=UPI001D0FD341|nr:sulfatase-like hydrolase/transferase [Marinobacter sp. DY40_1A1]MBK1885414.1 hypothetical protein [Marinobacter sp. DY40_1A1]